MHTLTYIRELLARHDAQPRHHWGQNFLTDLNAMRLLVGLADLRDTDTVLEVGCGTGSLTEELADRACRVVVVEIDSTLAEITSRVLAGRTNVQLLNQDILADKHTIAPNVFAELARARQTCDGRVLLVANLPYAVATVVVLDLLCAEPAFDGMYFTVQKEVAEKLAATGPGPHYGIPAVLVQAVADVRIARILGPHAFWPPPKVDSAVVTVTPNTDRRARTHDYRQFQQIVSLLFAHRRKTIRATLRHTHNAPEMVKGLEHALTLSGIDTSRRAESLTVDQFIELANRYSAT